MTYIFKYDIIETDSESVNWHHKETITHGSNQTGSRYCRDSYHFGSSQRSQASRLHPCDRPRNGRYRSAEIVHRTGSETLRSLGSQQRAARRLHHWRRMLASLRREDLGCGSRNRPGPVPKRGRRIRAMLQRRTAVFRRVAHASRR